MSAEPNPGKKRKVKEEKLSPVSRASADIFERLIRMVETLSFKSNMNPTQWAALRYFNEANKSSRTVRDFAKHNATTKGTASRTTGLLVEKGLLIREDEAYIGPLLVVTFTITKAGKQLLESDPLLTLAASIESLPAAERGNLVEILDSLSADMEIRFAEKRSVQKGRPGRKS